MSSRTLVQPGQPLAIGVLLRIYRFAASLKLAVVLILWLAATLAVGTFVEAAYGTPVAQYGVYQTWWFNLLLGLLAVNIFCAASIRYPWKRHQTGFVITHIGLLTLIFGTALSRWYGIDAQVFVHEFSDSGWAREREMKLHLLAHKGESESDDDLRMKSRDAGNPKNVYAVPPIWFKPGPFSWRDYDRIFTLGDLPKNVIHRDESSGTKRISRWLSGWMFAMARRSYPGDVLSIGNGIRVEVLDYYADSKVVQAPMVGVAVSPPRTTRFDADGKEVKSSYHWSRQDLSLHEMPGSDYPLGAQIQKAMFPGGGATFCADRDAERLKAFLGCTPKGPLGEKGQVVLWIAGKPRRFAVDETLGKGKLPVDGTPWEVEIAEFIPAARLTFNAQTQQHEIEGLSRAESRVERSYNPAVQINLHHDGAAAGRLILLSDEPNRAIHAHRHKIYGDYWFDHKAKTVDERRAFKLGNRIDILQMQTGKDQFALHFRRWDKAIVVSGKLPADGAPETALDAFSMADQQKFYVQEYVPAAQPTPETVPLEFVKDKNPVLIRPSVKLRMTVDGNRREFWLDCTGVDPQYFPIHPHEHVILPGSDRKVSAILRNDAVDLGFRVKLIDFERRLDPGTSQPSHYSSLIDVARRDLDRVIMRLPQGGKSPKPVMAAVVLEPNEVFRADAVALTGDGKYLYWLDKTARTIERVQLNSADAQPQTVLARNRRATPTPVALALDDRHERLFWVEYGSHHEPSAVRSSNLAGGDVQTLATFPGRPTAIALDRTREVVYWSYVVIDHENKQTGGIGQVDFKGNDIQENLVTGLGDRVPSSLAVDESGERLYWTELKQGSIRSARLDGSGAKFISLQGQQRPTSIAVAGKRIYWADLFEKPEVNDHEQAKDIVERHRLWSADADGGNARIVAHQRIDDPAGLVATGDGELWWTQEALMKHNVWITMNAPIEHTNPKTGQRYRLFQENFDGPYLPGDENYERYVPSNVDAADHYMSVLTVNYDPGRPIRNIGCLTVVLGIATMFYMRAYFFRPRRREEESAAQQTPSRTAAQADETPARKEKEKSKAKTKAEVLT